MLQQYCRVLQQYFIKYCNLSKNIVIIFCAVGIRILILHIKHNTVTITLFFSEHSLIIKFNYLII